MANSRQILYIYIYIIFKKSLGGFAKPTPPPPRFPEGADRPTADELQYSLVQDKWVSEEELNQETLGDRKRKYGVFLDTLYK